ncbi:hypothetical protein [Gilvimarinus sp. DA14]|uniref:hypothetical protein n=1 Tax=Gilvimarinus sp. DA14 TaxID=2956798 RepID=UPI0020B6902F|nr:hypothetical protein [Gilvimarinus sp. DA14]UTF58909.1 hypothetical protein NHM04_10510 [Gilvimarinus sp. DA14]
MRTIIVLLLFPLLASAAELETAQFRIAIATHCEEGEVTCADVAASITDKQSQHTQFIQGGTQHTTCADGISPCRFLGYRFVAEDKYYSVSEGGLLTVTTHQGKEIYREQGRWDYEK